MALSRRSASVRRGGLIARIKLITPGGLRAGEYDAALNGPYTGRIPTRCAFQFSGLDGAEEVFPVEYVMRMMSDWSCESCDPYVMIQNTGVSVLIQGFFNPPPNATKAPISVERNNVVLWTTESTGISLSAIDRMKTAGGMDSRPFQACLNISCFVRLPQVQLAFRFMGPGDPVRTRRLVELASEAYDEKRAQIRQDALRKSEAASPDTGCAPVTLVPEATRKTGWCLSRLLGPFKRLFSSGVATASVCRYLPSWLLTAGVTSITTGLMWIAYERVKYPPSAQPPQ
ncbi:nuclear egress membrane protein [Falconid herpesvirus 1]|uniref:Nuclear egress membrane protein n=1 Tax=Falconid herpesvirus 1 TaxID=1510155 RepID=A0A068EPJ9_9ALPH|nr:nuclear egress membrane protein [Falconid herpesvirus 1]AID52738.1 nuclear egress membrane protein [Falconid herpesvirus 1]